MSSQIRSGPLPHVPTFPFGALHGLGTHHHHHPPISGNPIQLCTAPSVIPFFDRRTFLSQVSGVDRRRRWRRWQSEIAVACSVEL
nr:hypothetical protein Itr_chr02CG24730 [Ipomoea trifida]